MLTDVRLPVPDQTIESIVAAAWLRNPWPTWEKASAAISGSASSKLRRLVHGGWRDAFETLETAGFLSTEDLVQRHSYLSLFQPFLDAEAYAKLRTALAEGQVAKLSALSRSRVLPAGSLRFCPVCASREISKSGYAVAHRSHQIAGVVVCWEHGIGLTTLRVKEHDGLAIGDRGLYVPSPYCELIPTERWLNQSEQAPTPAELQYAKFLHAAMSGQLPNASLRVRQRALNDRVDNRFRARRAPGLTIARLIHEGHSRISLCEAELDIPLAGSAIWPALVADGPSFAHHPIANLLAISVLYVSVEDYREAIATASQLTDHRESSGSRNLRLGRTKSCLTLALVKDFLRDIPLAQVAKRHQLDIATTKASLREYPRLANHRRRVMFDRRRITHRQAALELKQNHPRAARQDLKNLANGAFVWLANHDRKWMDSHFPLKGCLMGQNTFYDVKLDTGTAASITVVVDQLVREGRAHLRRSWSLLVACLGKEVQSQIRAGRLPITATSIREHEETKLQHRDRCLGMLRMHVKAGRANDAQRWASELLLNNPGDRTVISRVLACLLPRTEQQANRADRESTYAPS